MNKNFSPLLVLLSVFFLVLPGISRAGGSNDFMALQVPNVSQAASFFQNLMNCDAVDQGGDYLATSMLLDCGNGTMVELSSVPPAVHSKRQPHRQGRRVIRFATADATATLAWLHSRGIVVAGHPTKLRQSNGQEETIVNFIAPWGQTMQLVSYATDRLPRIDDAHAVQLASP